MAIDQKALDAVSLELIGRAMEKGGGEVALLHVAAPEIAKMRDFIGSLVQLHAWGTGAFEVLTADDVWNEAEKAGIVAPDPHPQPCPIEECPCGEFDGDLWRLAWNPPTAPPPGDSDGK